jgi:hypothetical protein
MKKIIFALLVMGVTSLFAESTSMNADVWKLNKTWTAKDGKISGSNKASLLLPKKKTIFTEMELEAEVTPSDPVGTNWKAVGLILYKAPNEFWQFAFIESPDKEKKPKRHFVELKCKKGKVWGHESKLKLKRLKALSFDWKYGKTYKLKLKLTPERIDGLVYAKGSDKVLAHIAYELKDGTVKSGMPVLKCKFISADFSNIKLEGK